MLKKLENFSSVLSTMQSHDNSFIAKRSYFCFQWVLRLILNFHELIESTMHRSIKASSSINSKMLAKSLGIVAARIELIVISYVDPESNEHVNILTSSNYYMKNRDQCFSFKIILVTDISIVK